MYKRSTFVSSGSDVAVIDKLEKSAGKTAVQNCTGMPESGGEMLS